MMAILIDMEMPDSCFLCRFCRRQEYGEYVGEDTAWSCVASKKRITDGRDLIATFKHPDCPLVEVCTLVEVPDAQPDRNAQERYEDLCEYFKDCSDKGMGILGDRKEFKAWLERVHWHVVRCDELGRELEKLKSAQPERWDTCFNCPLSHGCPFIKGCTNDQAEQYACEIPIGCPLDKKSAQPEKRTDKRTETHACDLIKRQDAIDIMVFECGKWTGLAKEISKQLRQLPSAQPDRDALEMAYAHGETAAEARYYEMLPKWIPVTKDTLPIKGKVVIVKGKTGTWDFGTYRGYSHVMGEGDIHLWNWKKNTLKRVYWWMYKDGALPGPTGGEQDETD